MPDHPRVPERPLAPGHTVRSGTANELLDLAWPVPLRLSSWATAASAGLVPIDTAAMAAGLPSAVLELGRVTATGRRLVGFLSEAGHPAPVSLPANVLPELLAAGGGVLSIGEPGAVLWADEAGSLTIRPVPHVGRPAAANIGDAERQLLAAVTSAAEVIADLGVGRPDPEAHDVLAQLPRLFDEHPMPPGTSGRARLLRDRAATLLVGVELALAPLRDAPTRGLDEPRRDVLSAARRSGWVALQAAANDQSERLDAQNPST